MRRRFLICVAAAAALAVAGSAQAIVVAGWDFSQYFGTGLLSINGSTFTNTLDANYSNMDPTFGAGAESAAFGTMYVNGSFGSTNVPAGSGTEQFVPTSGSLLSNLQAGTFHGQPFDSFTVLAAEGQVFQSALGMTASAATSVVFEADLTPAGMNGVAWHVSFGGRTFGGTSTVGVEFSPNGTSWTSYGSVNLTESDGYFVKPLSVGLSGKGYVRLSLSPSGGQPVIDNVAILANVKVCSDGIDNDGDGRTDYSATPGAGDDGCFGTTDNSEFKDCNDRVDNDNDGTFDYAGGPNGEALDSFCAGNPNKIREKTSCGLGFELALALPALATLRRRKRALV